MSKTERLRPRTDSEFLQAKEDLRKTIKGMNFTHANTWKHIHAAACDLRNWMTKERDKAKSINTRKKELESLGTQAARLSKTLSGFDRFHALQLDHALRVNYREFAGDHGAPGLDEFKAGLDALQKVSRALGTSLEKRMEGDGNPSKPPAETDRIRFILWPVCLHLAKYEKKPQRLAVIRAVFEAAAHMPADGSDIPKRQSDLFGRWAQTAPGKRAIAAWQGIYKRITAEK